MNNSIVNDFRSEVSDLLRSLRLAGIAILAGNNGENDFRPGESGLHTEEQFLDEICACDDCALFVALPGSMKRRQLYLVFGNSPGELVADYSDVAELSAVVQAHSDKWEHSMSPLASDLFALGASAMHAQSTHVAGMSGLRVNPQGR